MMASSTNRLRNKLLLTYIPIVIVLMVIFSVINYQNMKTNLHESFIESRHLSEVHIIDTISLIDSGYRMLEVKLESELNAEAEDFLSIYEDAGDLGKLDVAALKKQVEDVYDYMVIDQDTTIIKSSEPLALGFNFKTFDSELGQKIDSIRKGNDIWYEQLRTNVGTGRLSKFAYIPTKDHHYLLEVGYSIGGFDTLIDELKPQHYINTLLSENPNVESIRIFDTYGFQMVDSGENFLPTKESQEIVSNMAEINELNVVVDNNIIKHYVKVELNQKREKTLANTDRIVEITYSKELMNQKLERLYWVTMSVNFLVIVGLSFSIVILTGRVTKPLETLKSVSEEIAHGNYNQLVKIDTKDEIGELAESFNIMIQDINKSFQENEKQKVILEKYTKNLEEIVQERTKEIANQKRILERIALIDSLTEIPNRRSFTERFENEWKRASRDKTPLSLMIADVDWFKNYNDNYGHSMGDVVLKSVASVLNESISRATDFVARIGGEEFAVILPNTGSENATLIAKKMIKMIYELQIEHQFSETCSCLTISIGGATWTPDPDKSRSDFFKIADDMLYEAKASGKNKVVWLD